MQQAVSEERCESAVLIPCELQVSKAVELNERYVRGGVEFHDVSSEMRRSE